MLIVISPAKTLDFETKPTTNTHSQPRFIAQSKTLINELRQLDVVQIADLMSLSDKLAALNVARYESWQPSFSFDNAKQALLAFKGDVYTGLEAETMNEADLDYAQTHLRILSGLYGVLKPLDLMQPYRLEMGTKLANDKGKDLYQFWGDTIKKTIETDMDDGVLINLASNEYFKSVQAKQLDARIITPVFKDQKNGQYKMISFYAKKARGLMSRYIIDHKLTDPEAIKGFDYEGYYYSEAESTGDECVFLREHD